MKFTLAALVSLLALSIGSAEEEKPKPKEYPLGEDSMPKESVPKGKVTKHQIRSEVYPGTIREYFVYVPAQYDEEGEEKAAVMVFQDGHAYVGENGQIRATVVFDNLIASGEMPITIGIFVNPGWFTNVLEKEQGWKAPEGVGSNRAV